MSQPHTNAHGSVFVTTHWTAVLRAAEPSSAEREALEELCAVYFRPIYAFVRRRGYDAPDAEDLAQEFFAKLLSKQYLRAVDPRRRGGPGGFAKWTNDDFRLQREHS
jgi:RNA polymerase sigma-70 factor (ECF subfamily)